MRGEALGKVADRHIFTVGTLRGTDDGKYGREDHSGREPPKLVPKARPRTGIGSSVVVIVIWIEVPTLE